MAPNSPASPSVACKMKTTSTLSITIWCACTDRDDGIESIAGCVESLPCVLLDAVLIENHRAKHRSVVIDIQNKDY